MSDKPNAIILGGVNTCARALAAYLVPLEGEPLVSNLRIVDKYSVIPATTYIGLEFPKILAKDNVEYKQANLTVAATVTAVFDPPEGQAPYTFVFDLSGDVAYDRPEQVQVNHTLDVARLIGEEAARRKVKAYIRLQHPWYEFSEKGAQDEKADIKPVRAIGVWWHESLRTLGAIAGLNLVILRVGLVYGPYIEYGVIPNVLTVAAVYGYMNKPMKSLWSPGKNSMNTVHSDDVAAGLWAAAQWIAGLGRSEADKVAGEDIPFLNEKSKVAEVTGMRPANEKIVAPLFNLADDNHTTLHTAGETMTGIFGTTFEYHSFVTSSMIRFRLEDVVEDINEAHVNTWAEMITKANPPIPNTQLSAYMDTFTLSKHVVALSNAKFKRVVGYELQHPKFTPELLRDIVNKWKEEGSWPTLDA
ncbi:NAD-P-binding protein [Auriscalpium vulgare]|uniref:NAD-P-binding protein n=1 Tax=Auriscalpium vulgare TaxID=40419 RepID=A0ACB8RWD6_9AGAM|nr:NAD-P-binding protein [Auriscalpium vulgare]